MLVSGLACALFLAGCSVEQQQPLPAVQDPETTEQTAQTPPPAPVPVFFAPLTGEGLMKRIDQRAVMVVINNHPAARPQSGLTEADIMFEVLAEGEITRLLALYQSSTMDKPIGPVRSIRPYIIEIGKSFDAIQSHAGGSPDGYAKIDKEKIASLDEITKSSATYWRESFRKAPHNLYTNLEKLYSGAERRKYEVKHENADKPVFAFADKTEALPVSAGGTSLGAGSAKRADITFLIEGYVVSYEWDEASGLYKRMINNEKHVDLNNQEQLSASNVIIMGAKHRVTDNVGRREVTLTGSGPAKLLQKGLVIEGEWKRSKDGAPFEFGSGGKEWVFQPGQTHIMIVPTSPTFEGHVILTP